MAKNKYVRPEYNNTNSEVQNETNVNETINEKEIEEALNQESIINESTLDAIAEQEEIVDTETTEDTEKSDEQEDTEDAIAEQEEVQQEDKVEDEIKDSTSNDTDVQKEDEVDTQSTEDKVGTQPTEVEKQPSTEDTTPTVSNISEILGSKVSIKEKIVAISKSDNITYRSLANKLLSYNDKMFGTDAIKASSGAANNYDLYNVIKQVVSESNVEVFRNKFTIINLAFLAFKDEGFNEVKLHRFDYEWKWGKESLDTYQYLVTMITILADRSTREVEVGKGILDRALNKDVVSLSDVAIQNIIKYYKA